MKIEEYLQSLPKEIISGEDVQLQPKTFREIFKFCRMGSNDTFYHLGCGDGSGLKIALDEYKVKKAVGIDINSNKIEKAKAILEKNKENSKLICQDICASEISEATIILFWFTEPEIIESMMKKFEKLNPNCKIVTIWAPLPGCLPDEIDFPYIINQVPFKQALSLKEQLLSVFNVKCIDFVTAWEYAERYTKAIGPPEAGNDRFLTILQTLVIWINAKNLGVACGDTIPESIQTYIGILRNYFDIEVEHLFKK